MFIFIPCFFKSFRFNWTGLVWFGLIGLSYLKSKPKLNQTRWFFLLFNRFIWFFLSVWYFRLIKKKKKKKRRNGKGSLPGSRVTTFVTGLVEDGGKVGGSQRRWRQEKRRRERNLQRGEVVQPPCKVVTWLLVVEMVVHKKMVRVVVVEGHYGERKKMAEN